MFSNVVTHIYIFLENQIPSISPELDTINAIVNVIITMTVEVNDTDDDVFVFNNTLPEGATFTMSGDKYGEFSWKPSSLDTVRLM